LVVKKLVVKLDRGYEIVIACCDEIIVGFFDEFRTPFLIAGIVFLIVTVLGLRVC